MENNYNKNLYNPEEYIGYILTKKVDLIVNKYTDCGVFERDSVLEEELLENNQIVLAYKYSLNLRKAGSIWGDGEKYIFKYMQYFYNFAVYGIKERIKEHEHILYEDGNDFYLKNYCHHFKLSDLDVYMLKYRKKQIKINTVCIVK